MIRLLGPLPILVSNIFLARSPIWEAAVSIDIAPLLSTLSVFQGPLSPSDAHSAAGRLFTPLDVRGPG